MNLSIDGIAAAREPAVVPEDGTRTSRIQRLEPHFFGSAQVELNQLLLNAAHENPVVARRVQQAVHIDPGTIHYIITSPRPNILALTCFRMSA